MSGRRAPHPNQQPRPAYPAYPAVAGHGSTGQPTAGFSGVSPWSQASGSRNAAAGTALQRSQTVPAPSSQFGSNLTDFLSSTDSRTLDLLTRFVEAGNLNPDSIQTLGRNVKLLADRLDQVSSMRPSPCRRMLTCCGVQAMNRALLNGTAVRQSKKWLQYIYNLTRQIPKTFILTTVQRAPGLAHSGGDFGDVYRGTYGSHMVAIKVSRFYQSMDADLLDAAIKVSFCCSSSLTCLKPHCKKLYRDAYIWKTADSAYIVPLFGLSNTVVPGQFGLVMPFYANGNIVEFCSRHSRADKPTLVRALSLTNLRRLTLGYS
jgi:hypothetical protein